MKCPRCDATMVTEGDGTLKCLSCGQERSPLLGRKLADLDADAAIKSHADWTQIAIARLTELIAAVVAIEVKRDEAERLRKALTVFGAEPIPDLPWQAPKRWAKAHDACVDCGRTTFAHASHGRCSSCDTKFRTAQPSANGAAVVGATP